MDLVKPSKYRGASGILTKEEAKKLQEALSVLEELSKKMKDFHSDRIEIYRKSISRAPVHYTKRQIDTVKKTIKTLISTGEMCSAIEFSRQPIGIIMALTEEEEAVYPEGFYYTKNGQMRGLETTEASKEKNKKYKERHRKGFKEDI